MKLRKDVPCQSKNPTTCPYHGNISRMEQRVADAVKANNYGDYQAAMDSLNELKTSKATEAELRRLQQGQHSVAERKVFAQSEDANTLTKLSKDRDVAVRREVAGNKNSPESVLIQMALNDRDSVVVSRAVSNIAPASLHKLVGGNSMVREALAEHRAAPTDILSSLAKHPDEDVRARVARNLQTPPAVLAGLMGARSVEVRLSAIRNPNTPYEALAPHAVFREDMSDEDTLVANDLHNNQGFHRSRFMNEAGLERDAIPDSMIDELMRE